MFIRRRLLQVLSFIVIVTMMFSVLQLPSVSAQGSDGIKRRHNAQTGKVSFIGPESGRSLSAAKALGITIFGRPSDPGLALAKRYGPEFGLKNPGRDLTKLKTHRADNGRLSVRFQQNYQRIPVMGGELMVNTNSNGDLYSINGEVSPDISISTRPTVTASQAKQMALKSIAKWHQMKPEDFRASTPELWIYDESLLRPSARPVELVWRMEVTAKDVGMPVRELVLVNAQRGSISLHFNQVDTSWKVGGQTGTSQDVSPTPTPAPTATPEPVVTPGPTGEDVSTLEGDEGEVTTLAGVNWYVVASGGNDSNVCTTPASPCATIQGAINQASANDIINVADGAYTFDPADPPNPTSNVVIINKSITLSGGWLDNFSNQTGVSIIDGSDTYNGILATGGSSTVVVDHFVIQNSFTGSDSGGIYLYAANFTLKNSSVIDNQAGQGAGIFVIGNANLTIVNSTISGNRAGKGGGIYVASGTVNIQYSTIAHNSTVFDEGGGVFRNGGTLNVYNSILANNTGAVSPNCNSVNASDYNVIGSTTGCTPVLGSWGTHDQADVPDAGIESTLSGTIPVHKLVDGGPAIDAGDLVACSMFTGNRDQRGALRPQGDGCDIGAFELTTGLRVMGGSDQNVTVGSPFALPFTVQLLDDSENPVSGATITFTAPTIGASGTFENGTYTTDVTTGIDGQASATVFTANMTVGSYNVTATAAGYPGIADFSLHNRGAVFVSTTGSDSNTCTSPASPCLTINGAIGKAVAGDVVKISVGTYTGTGTGAFLNKNVTLSGGWNASFTTQSGHSTIDGQGTRQGVSVNNGVTAVIERMTVRNGTSGVVISGSTSPGGKLTVNNSTVSGNSSSGLATDGGAILVLNNSTVSGNRGVGIYKPAGALGTVTLKNTIVAGNSTAGSGADCSGAIASAGYNLIGNTLGCAFAAGGSDRINVDPQLGGFVDYYPLRSGSPAIDTGNPAAPGSGGNACLATDERGVTRPVGTHCDIGAYEYTVPGSAASLLVIDGNGQRVAPGLVLFTPLQVAVLDSQGSPVAGVEVNFTAPDSGPSGTFAPGSTLTAAATTDTNGIASAPTFTANELLGAYQVVASASGAGSVNFNLHNISWFVATTGSDANDCATPATPCATINGAIGKAGTGETIKIALGTYTGTGTQAVLINKSITLSGGWDAGFASQSGQSAIDGQGARRVMTVNSGVTAVIERILMQNGYYSTGPGIYNSAGTLILNNSTVSGNTAPVSSVGGGIYNTSGSTLTLNRSVVAENSGPGIDSSGSLVILNNSTISDNEDQGVDHSGGSLTLNNSTVSGNGSSGLYIAGSTTVALNNSTISDNGGVGVYRSAGTITLKNTIVAGNSTMGSGADCFGTIGSAGYNLIGNDTGCTFGATTGDLTKVNPQLGALVGSPGYHPLPAGSLAIDAGNPATPGSGGNACQANDERGIARPVGSNCDIGAYEYTAPGSPVRLFMLDGDGQHALPGLAFADPLIVMALDGQGSPVPGVEVTFTAPESGASGTFAAGGARTTTVTTDANGTALTSTFTANAELGSYPVVASLSGVDPVNFTLHNIIWFVAPTGSDANDCRTPATACATINAALGKVGLVAGDTILVAEGTYTGSGSGVVLLNKDVLLSGGWNALFTTQQSWSTLDGQNARTVMVVGDTTSATVERFVIRNGRGSIAGGIENKGTLVLSNSLIRNNACTNTSTCGGGIYIDAGMLTLNNSTVTGNTSATNGGGIFNGSSGTLTLNNSTLSGNTARSGGGLYSYGTVLLNNGTISNNRSTGSGGGISFYSGYGGTFTIKNTLVAGNSAGSSGQDCAGPIGSAGYNLIGSNSGCTFSTSTGDLVGTASSPINARLAPLPYDDKSTLTHALMSGSPARDAGNPAVPGSGGNACSGTDQRGLARPFGSRCDIGAFEYQGAGTIPAYIVSYSGSPQYLATGGSAPSVLKAVVLDDDGDTVSGSAVTFTAPASGASAVFAGTVSNTSTAVTDADGIAVSPAFSANTTPGGYVIRATVAGGLGSADFQIVNGAQVKTYSANNNDTLPGTLKCSAAQPQCTGGSNPHADSAHAHAMGTYAFYWNQHGRTGLDNQNMTIISTVDYCYLDPWGDPDYDECPFYNAYWSGEQVVYGNGRGYALADDVVAHELTHAVTQHESNLFYYYQSGAINESFSDLWGEYYDQINGGNDPPEVKWEIGEDAGIAMRNMRDPTLKGDPDRMTSSLYNPDPWAYDSGGVHSNSGLNNKATFLMVEGGDFNSRTISPLGWEKTIAIYYEANTNLLVSGADYSDLYYVLPQACTNLIGQHGITTADCLEVTEALDAVEMYAQPLSNPNIDGAYCDEDQFVNFLFTDDLESGTGNWTFANGTYKRWQLDSAFFGPYAHSGEHSLYASDYPYGVTSATARLAPRQIPANTYLHFSHAYAFEFDPPEYGDPAVFYDGGVLEYSTSGGTIWWDAEPLMSYNGYDQVIFTEAGNPLSGKRAFAGASPGYIGTRLNLTSLTGKTVTFRWRLGLDEWAGDMGWWVDDVKIYQCLPRDLVAPGVVTDLTVTPGPTDGIANLTWTAPGEDGAGPSGPVAAYFVKWSDEPFTSWEDGTLVTSGLPIPVAPNGDQEMSVSGLLAGELYYFAVRAQDEQFNLSNYVTASGIAGFTPAEFLGAPILLSPPHKGVTNDLTPRLDWKDHQPRADYYRVQVATSSTFEDPSLVQNELADLSEFVVPSDLTSGGPYFWRVQAYDFDDQPALWSAVRYFTIDTLPPPVPAASFPASGASVRGAPLFRWSRAAGAVRYQFEIDDHETFDSPLFSIVQRLTLRRLPGGVRGTYYWRVRSQDAVGNWSDWSPASLITILPPR